MNKEITIECSPQLEAELRAVLKAHRLGRVEHDTSTPEMLMLATHLEKQAEDEALRSLVKALARRQAPALDCGVIDAVARLEQKARAAA